jgi:branched-chain amino acid aminotransferase
MIAWLNGRFVAAAELTVPVGDAGFILGATVTEQLRTFGGRLFLPEAHGLRLQDSLATVGIELPGGLTVADLLEAAAEVAAHNHARGPSASDLGVVIFATPGGLAAQHDGRSGPPLLAIHSFPLAFGLWSSAYQDGVSLRRVRVRQVPEECWPLQLKCRSRMHYLLADREAAAIEPGSRAVLEQLDGSVCETSTANLVVVRGGSLATPEAALEGISLGYLRHRAADLGLTWQPRRLLTHDLVEADEILLTSTPSCLLPATRFEGEPVGSGQPGPVYERLLRAWSDAVGLDIAAQARVVGRASAERDTSGS